MSVNLLHSVHIFQMNTENDHKDIPLPEWVWNYYHFSSPVNQQLLRFFGVINKFYFALFSHFVTDCVWIMWTRGSKRSSFQSRRKQRSGTVAERSLQSVRRELSCWPSKQSSECSYSVSYWVRGQLFCMGGQGVWGFFRVSQKLWLRITSLFLTPTSTSIAPTKLRLKIVLVFCCIRPTEWNYSRLPLKKWRLGKVNGFSESIYFSFFPFGHILITP